MEILTILVRRADNAHVHFVFMFVCHAVQLITHQYEPQTGDYKATKYRDGIK